MFKMLSTYICGKKYKKCNIRRVAVRPSYIWDARFLKVNTSGDYWIWTQNSLVAFAKELRKATVSSVISARSSSVGPHGTTWTRTEQIWWKLAVEISTAVYGIWQLTVKIGENNKKLSKKTNAHLRLLWLLTL